MALGNFIREFLNQLFDMLVAITGTPGTGKTSLSKMLASKGYETLALGDIVKEHGLSSQYDALHDTYIVDVDLFRDIEIVSDRLTFVEGHLSHHLTCELIIVLRCRPDTIYERLEQRGYSDEKSAENAESEMVGVILMESVDTGIPTYEIDCSDKTLDAIGMAVIQIINGETHDYLPGKIDWIGDC